MVEGSRPLAPAVMTARHSYLIGLIGAGIGPSWSPPLHEREAAAQGLRYLYRLIDIGEAGLAAAAAPGLVRSAELLGFDGLNVTHPCKQAVLDGLDDISPDAAALGAVNTVVFRARRAIGHNTDWSGFARSLDQKLPGASLGHVVVLGAGGAGSAAAYALARLGAGKVTIIDQDAARAAALAASLGPAAGACTITHTGLPGLVPALAGADGLVHATPTGMADHPGVAVPAGALVPSLWVADIVYRPLDTELIRAARRAGCRTLDGGAMAVFQAADAFRLFTGIEPDAGRMLAHFAELAEQEAADARWTA